MNRGGTALHVQQAGFACRSQCRGMMEKIGQAGGELIACGFGRAEGRRAVLRAGSAAGERDNESAKRG